MNIAVTQPSASQIPHADARLIDLWREFYSVSQEVLPLDRIIDSAVFLPPEVRSNIKETLPEIERRASDLHKRLTEIGLAIQKTRANTIEGLRIKARCVFWCQAGFEAWDRDSFCDQSIMQSLVEDLLGGGEVVSV